MSKITTSSIVIAPHWTQNPLSFFQGEAIDLQLQLSPIAEAYRFLEKLDSQKNLNVIRSRFLKIVFHRLKEKLCIHYMRSNDSDDVARIISASGLTSSDLADIKSKISRWTDLGGRIDALCRSIGSNTTHDNSHLGSLFCLPEDCHDELCVRLPNSGADIADYFEV